jgi:hypothetical protein
MPNIGAFEPEGCLGLAIRNVLCSSRLQCRRAQAPCFAQFFPLHGDIRSTEGGEFQQNNGKFLNRDTESTVAA